MFICLIRLRTRFRAIIYNKMMALHFYAVPWVQPFVNALESSLKLFLFPTLTLEEIYSTGVNLKFLQTNGWFGKLANFESFRNSRS